MKLILNFIDDEFTEYLIEQMQDWMYQNLKPDKLKALQTYVDALPEYKSIYRKSLNLKDICFASVHNLTYRKYQGKTLITFNYNTRVFGLQVKLVDVIKLINYGNLIARPYPIFDDMFQHFKTYLSYYYALYEQEYE